LSTPLSVPARNRDVGKQIPLLCSAASEKFPAFPLEFFSSLESLPKASQNAATSPLVTRIPP